MAIKEYEPGTAFPGVIGRTDRRVDAGVAAAAAGQGRRAQRALHRPRRHRLRAARLLRLADPHAEPRPARGERPALHQHAHHRALLAEPLAACSPGATTTRTRWRASPRARPAIPGSNGLIPFENGFLSEMLLAARLQHVRGRQVAPHADRADAARPARYDRWPLGRGFERFYGFLGGDTNQYYPDLVYDNHQVEPPQTPEEGYHLTEDLVDHAIEFIADAKQVAPDKPFFLYFCTGRDARAAPRAAASGPTSTRASSTTAGTPTARRCSSASSSSGILPPGTRAVARAIPTSPAWDSAVAPTRSASTRA